jgi:hypothetical protein
MGRHRQTDFFTGFDSGFALGAPLSDVQLSRSASYPMFGRKPFLSEHPGSIAVFGSLLRPARFATFPDDA